MTIGIYCLKFNGTDKVYIGKSDNIEKRFTQHKNNLKKGIANYKLQEAYSLYGLPIQEVVLECELDELAELEDEAIEIFDAVENGFNIYSFNNQTPTSGWGDTSANSIYSNDQIIQAFFLLIAEKYYSAMEIAKITKVSEDIVSKISCGGLHRWLQEAYPAEYQILQNKKYSRYTEARNLTSIKLGAANQGIKYPKIRSPDGVIFEIDNAYRFAKERNLAANHFQEVLNGHRKSHKGWRLCQSEQV